VNARVPASFEILAGGRLTPASVSAPAFLAVQVSVSSADSAAHQLALRTPTPHSLTVAAHGHASVLIAGLRAGTYAVDVDGRPKGALIIGGEPGP
jgi:hypothetical protein